jgi:hypothetical protein
MAGGSASGVFPPAARSPVVRSRSSTTIGGWGTQRAKKNSTGRKKFPPTARRGGGRGGAMPFPANGRRTWRLKARTSNTGARGNYFHTWLGRRGGETGCRR